MANEKKPTTIKKYANRRLLRHRDEHLCDAEDLATMVKRGEDFLVCDAKSGEDITRPVLTQIIFEQEGKDGQSLLPVSFLRQLIRFYGDSMQMLVPAIWNSPSTSSPATSRNSATSSPRRWGPRPSGSLPARLSRPWRSRRARIWWSSAGAEHVQPFGGVGEGPCPFREMT